MRQVISIQEHGGTTRKILTIEIGRRSPYHGSLNNIEETLEYVREWLTQGVIGNFGPNSKLLRVKGRFIVDEVSTPPDLLPDGLFKTAERE